ncbi:hypothetical protein [Paraburkholderia phenoliruptrix]|uniref:hypothetical protein n=1 Tax=Paraburkholderia phenoliruptrix TaxID=252970 RepID=UPI002869C78D|nr:hypothetical protein [Paraburkholderia phenoliruptrix]WMY11275.1 hypothetical protein P3F88_32005 [Paraburkholderia phenoliruptrix]
MQLSDFTVHYVARFPEVRCTPETVHPGYSAQWRLELEALIERGEPFFMLFADGDFDEAPEDTRVRAVWLKENKARLAKVCRSIVSIESDAAKRAKLLVQLVGLERAFGIPRLVASSEAEGRVAGFRSVPQG